MPPIPIPTQSQSRNSAQSDELRSLLSAKQGGELLHNPELAAVLHPSPTLQTTMNKTSTPWFGLGWGLRLGLSSLVLSKYSMAQDQEGEDTDVADSVLNAKFIVSALEGVGAGHAGVLGARAVKPGQGAVLEEAVLEEAAKKKKQMIEGADWWFQHLHAADQQQKNQPPLAQPLPKPLAALYSPLAYRHSYPNPRLPPIRDHSFRKKQHTIIYLADLTFTKGAVRPRVRSNFQQQWRLDQTLDTAPLHTTNSPAEKVLFTRQTSLRRPDMPRLTEKWGGNVLNLERVAQVRVAVPPTKQLFNRRP
ncbi:hypothetical protein B484DRAFT_455005 [Ochromonadaceae sp. CCMP2298]|nr:hypothetical protein B484DRAFT_455005 [Ochromonadaceae sp. CCMP2298]